MKHDAYRRSLPMTRRRFLGQVGVGAAAWSGLAAWPHALLADDALHASTEDGPVMTPVAEETFATLYGLTPNTWAVVSKPLDGGYETLCNGGFVAGSSRLLAFESYGSPAGATWFLDQVNRVTDRAPTDLVLSHHHGDHVRGLATFAAAKHPPRLITTTAIRDQIREGLEGAALEVLESATILEPGRATPIDLGGVAVTLTAHAGHTKSDIVARVGNDVTFYGDLLWNGLFPNYRDATPSRLKQTTQRLISDLTPISIAGHGSPPSRVDIARYSQLLDVVEAAAKASFRAGLSAEEAILGYSLPADLGAWTFFNPRFLQVAFEAWYRELEA